ncbi:plasminogen receptor (KT) [Arapaima gigas]
MSPTRRYLPPSRFEDALQLELFSEYNTLTFRIIKRRKSIAMGFIMSKSMDQNFKRQQEFMLLNSRLQLERQILMQNQMRERQMAMQIAWSREFLKYYGTFFGLAAFGLTVGAMKRKRPGILVPIVPLGFVFAYQADMAYGTLTQRMKMGAEDIMVTEHERLELPHGTPTFETIEKARRAQSTFFIDK